MKRLLTLIATLMVMFCLASCDEDSNVTVKDNASGNSVGNVESNEAKNNKNVFIPDDSYVLYRETYTKTDVIKIYEYNEKGHVTRVIKNKPDGSTEETIYTNTYNSDGSYSVHEKGPYVENIMEYDNQGRLVVEINEPDSKSMMKKNTYTYADNGIVYVVTTDFNGYVKNKETRHFNKDGLLELSEHYLSNDKLYARMKYEYDEYGNETTHYQINSEGEKDSNNMVFTWTQEYDEYGRLVKKEKRDTAINAVNYNEIYEYNDEARTYTVNSSTSVFDKEYRPLAECIK